MQGIDLHISLIAKLPLEKRRKILSQLTDVEADQLIYDWSFLARRDQIEPPGNWRIWLYLAGRGAGKTRSGAEWVRNKIKHGCRRVGLIAPTASSAREVMVEGDGALLSVCWHLDHDSQGRFMGRPEYEPSRRMLRWANGAIATTYSAEEPDRLRGPQHDAIWCDELASWWNPQEVWDMAMFGLRLGDNPRAMISTTPKPIPVLRELMRDENTVITRATTYMNRSNLARAFMDQIITKYKGTRLGRQELGGEILEESEGALWSRTMIEKARLKGKMPEMRRVVVGVDPAITSKVDSNLTGIVVAGLGVDDRGYVIADGSGRYSPDGWAKRAVSLFESTRADRFVAEGNQGGEMVRHTINSVMPNAPVRIVHASRGKQARAEPIVALYEQDKIRHCGTFPELEDQCCTWEPLGDEPSPDRIDALVWALTDLMLGQRQAAVFGVYGETG